MNEVVVQKQANPGPLGLLGFGLTTVLLSMKNSGLFSILGVDTLAMGIFVGGLMQLIAGALEFKKGSTFGGTAFTMYGFFWLAFVAITVLPGGGEDSIRVAFQSDHLTHGLFLLLWAIVTGFMALAAFKHIKLAFIMFTLLTVTFLFLSLGAFSQTSILTNIGGYLGLVTGLLAIYQAVALIVNEEHQKIVLPLP